MDKKLVVALNAYNYGFSIEEQPDASSYSVNHLKIKVSTGGITVTGAGIKEVYKAIDFRIRPGLEGEVISEILGYLMDPEKKSTGFWREFFELMRK